MEITLGNWKSRMDEDMRLVDYRPRTREGYGLALRLFFERLAREPRDVTEDDVRAYVLYLRDERKISPSYLVVTIAALRFFFQRTMRVDWEVFELLRVQRPKTLPVVLSPGEVRMLLRAVRQPVRRMFLTTTYALGLRLGECLRLESTDIDSQRLRVSIRNGKGLKDRGVPLPRALLERLRIYWKMERPASATKLLFVGHSGERAFEESTIQKTFTAALRDSKVQKHASVHTLRHSYATHLVESRISLRTVQELLGHKSLRTTEVYLHVTTASAEHLQEAVDQLVAHLLDFGACALA